VTGRRGRNEDRRIPEKLSPSRSAGRGPRHPGLSGTSTPHDGKRDSGLRLPGTSLGTAQPIHQGVSTRSSREPVKHEPSKPQLTPKAFQQGPPRGRTIKQDPGDIIDLTLDDSDVEGPDVPHQRPPATIVYDKAQGAPANPATLIHPPSERPPSDPFTNVFSTRSAILGPALHLTKGPHDKPRLFVRYTLGFEACLANISAHGFIDQVCMVPQW
jgi:hypothetical protein